MGDVDISVSLGGHRLVIQPFKHCQKMDDEHAMRLKRTLWRFMLDIVIDLKAAKGNSFEEVYRMCYNLCLHRYGKHAERMLKFAINVLVRTHYHTQDITDAIKKLNDIYLYYNRTVAKAHGYEMADQLLALAVYQKEKAELVQFSRRLERRGRINDAWTAYYWAPSGLPNTFMAKRKPEWDRLAGVDETKRDRLDDEAGDRAPKRHRLGTLE